MTTIAPSIPKDTPLPLDVSCVSSAVGLRLVPTLCCLCGVEDVDPVGVGEDFEYRTSPDTFLAVRCRRCGLVFLNPRPADEEMQRIYPDNYHAFEFDRKEFGFVYRVRRWLEARRVRRWCHGLPTNACVLDVGCGDGFHLELLRDYGEPDWRVEGIDTDARAVAVAQARGLDVWCASVEDADLPEGTYHLILLVMTVEHLTDPVRTLRAVTKLLAPNGGVVIITDNAASPDFSLFGGRHWGGYHFPRHLNLFTKATLRALAAKCRLEVESIKTDFSPVNWVYSIRNLLDDWGAPRWLVNRFSLKATLALTVFTLWDTPLSLIGRGAILRAVFRRDGGTA